MTKIKKKTHALIFLRVFNDKTGPLFLEFNSWEDQEPLGAGQVLAIQIDSK